MAGLGLAKKIIFKAQWQSPKLWIDLIPPLSSFLTLVVKTLILCLSLLSGLTNHKYLAVDVTANCICEIPCLALEVFDHNTVH